MARELATLVPTKRPENPQLGWMYVDETDSHLYFFNGAEWKQVDGGGPPESPPGQGGLRGTIGDRQVAFGAGDEITGSDALQFAGDTLTVAGITNTMAVLFTPMDPTRRDTVPEGAMYYSAGTHKLYLNTDLGWVALN